MDSVVRDIQNTQCLLNVEHLSAGCPHVTLQFADSKGDVGLGLVKEGLVMVEVRKEKQFQKVVRAVGGGTKMVGAVGVERPAPGVPRHCQRPRGGWVPQEPVKEQGPTILLLLRGKDNGFGFVGVFKKKLITSQINWLPVWLKTGAESFPLPISPPRAPHPSR